ncbi:MAG: putative 2OG-Fe(II) oxygenase [Gammaproteobacteria bacterium]
MNDRPASRSFPPETQGRKQLIAEARQLAADRRFGRAVECLNLALEARPDDSEALKSRGRILQDASRFEEAMADYQRLVSESPSDAESWLELGHCLRALERLDEAAEAFLRTLELAPHSVESMVTLGAIDRDREKFESATGWLKKAVAANPNEVRAHCILGTTYLAAGEAGNGRASLEQAFSLNPYDRTTIAYLYVACCQTGDAAAALALAQPDILVRSYQYGEPGTETRLDDSLNERLADHVRGHSSLEYERSGNTTRKGAHTGNLLEAPATPASQLFEWIEHRIRQYLESLPRTGTHPYLAWSPDRWDIDAWGVVIQPGGYQEPHIHPDGWISGVYYVAVPDDIVSADDSREGCLELGTPPSPFSDCGQFPVQLLRPRPGKLNIFPSFLWHRTMPYEASGERICIAFDVRPRA